MFITYAQNFEDVILWRALKHVKAGFYVDVGAQHPLYDSVSLAFYEQGWRGIHVEPSENHAQLLRSARPDEEVLQMAVGMGRPTLVLFEAADTGLSTGNPDIAAKHLANNIALSEVVVPVKPLAEILSGVGRDIHWLKIDVEGMELEVIESWGSCEVRPWIVVVEATLPNSKILSHSEWEPLLLDLGYKFVYFDGLNRFYVSLVHLELEDSFGPGPNIFDEFFFTERSSSPMLYPIKSSMNYFSRKIEAIKKAIEDL